MGDKKLYDVVPIRENLKTKMCKIIKINKSLQIFRRRLANISTVLVKIKKVLLFQHTISMSMLIKRTKMFAHECKFKKSQNYLSYL